MKFLVLVLAVAVVAGNIFHRPFSTQLKPSWPIVSSPAYQHPFLTSKGSYYHQSQPKDCEEHQNYISFYDYFPFYPYPTNIQQGVYSVRCTTCIQLIFLQFIWMILIRDSRDHRQPRKMINHKIRKRFWNNVRVGIKSFSCSITKLKRFTLFALSIRSKCSATISIKSNHLRLWLVPSLLDAALSSSQLQRPPGKSMYKFAFRPLCSLLRVCQLNAPPIIGRYVISKATTIYWKVKTSGHHPPGICF